MRLEFESNVSSVPFAENETTENVAENASAQTSEMLREGIKAAQAGKRAEARHLLLRVTETEPQNENAWLWLASISEYPEELLIFLNNVLDVNPANVRAKEWMKQTKSLLAKTFVQRGIDASKENQNDFAKQCFYQAAAHDDSNEMAWLWLASVSDKAEEKVVHLNKSLQINPANEDAQTALKAVHHELAQTLLQKAIAAAAVADNQTASDLLNEVLEKSPEMEEAWMLKAKLSNNSSEKLRYYEKVLELNSDHTAAHQELKNVYQELAQKLLDNAKVAAFAGDSQTANQLLAEVLEKSPEMEEAWLLNSHLALGFDEKMRCFEKVLEINPNNEAAKSGLSTLRAFMPQIASGKDEYAQMAEEFAQEEEESFAEEISPESVSYFEDITHNESQAVTEELAFAQETELTEAPAFSEFTEVVEQEENQFSESSSLLEARETEAPETSQDFAKVQFDSQPDSRELLEATDEMNALDPIVEASEIEENLEPQIFSAETSPEESEDFSLETVAEPQAEVVSENVETVTEYHQHFENRQSETYSFESPEPTVYGQQTEVLEHQPTQMFEKPSGNFDYDDFSSQLFSNEPQTEEFVPMKEFAPETAQEFNADSAEEQSFVPDETVENNFQQSSQAETADENLSPTVEEVVNFEAVEEVETSQMAAVEAAETIEEFPAQTEQIYEETAPETFPQTQKFSAKSEPEVFHCPFCNVENDAQAFACESCHAVLSLSDLEMLLANQNADKEVLRQTVNRMEVEQTNRKFEEYELMFLGIGHINLKNLRKGFSYLQQASQLNQNNVLLAAQVNALAIRVDEIERQEEIHDSMPKGRKILVVDDSPTVRKLISSKLEKSGHEVFCAVDGMDAIAKLGEIVPDLILLDITMPRMDGYQVCKLIRSGEETKNIPVVMISGKDGFFDKVRGRMAGTTGYITKPFGPETLMKALEVYIKPTHEQNFDNSISPEA